MTTIISSKYSTNQGYEASGYVQCKVVMVGNAAPSCEIDIGDTTLSYNGHSPDLIVLPFGEAKLLRTNGLIDF